MKRDFKQITKDIALKGFFSEYLPPCFRLDAKVLNYSPSENCDLIKPYCFTMSRFNETNGRRNIYIPEIGSYIVAHNYIKDNNIIEEIINFTEETEISFSPILGPDGSIMTHEQSYDIGEAPFDDETDYSLYMENICKKLIESRGCTKILKLDISNCFASFYMHMIPTIIMGYEAADAEYKKSLSIPKEDLNTLDTKYLKYQKLDKILRRQNLNQTNGLLVGTLYSKIIIEGILSRIDRDLLSSGIKFSRYVDDYEVYIFDKTVDEVISIFERTLKQYGFSLNFEKKETLDPPFYIVENLRKLFKDLSNKELRSYELIKLFNTFLVLEKDGTKGATRYLLKSIETHSIDTKNTELYKSYLLSILSNDGRSLIKACHLLLSEENLELNDDDVALIIDKINYNIKCNYDLEVVWLIFLLVESGKIKKDTEVVKNVCSSSNELAHVILLRNNLLSIENLNIVVSKAKSWILNYELFAMSNIDEEEFFERMNIKENSKMYLKFKRNKIHFII